MAASKDKTAPKLSSSTPKSNASVELGSDITLNFNEAIKAGNGSITITNGADTRVIPIIDPQISISGKTLILNPKDDLYSGSIYSVVISNNAIQDTAGNAYVPAKTPLSFTTKGVPSTTPITVKPIQPSDTTAPVFTSAKVNGTSLIMSFNDTDLLNTTTALASSFSVISNGIDNSVTDIFVNPTSKTVALLLTNPVLNAQTVTVAYNDPTKDNDVNALQDISGNDVASFSAQSVVNNTKSSETVVTPKPVEPTFTLSPNVTSVDEGSTVKFIAISSVPAPTEGFDIPFVLSGTATVLDDYKEVYSSRVIHIPSGSTIGSVAFDTIADSKTEGTETLILSSKDIPAVTVNINDTSLTPAVIVPSIPVSPNTFSITTADSGTLTASLNKSLSESKNSIAFAVIKSDGSVVTWGNKDWAYSKYYGGDSSSVAKQLDGTIDVKQIYSNPYAFVALREDGSVVTWGDSSNGGDSSSVTKQLDGTIDVVKIASTTGDGHNGTFSALRADGSVVYWGGSENSKFNNYSSISKQIDGTVDVTSITPNKYAFAGIRTDGSVVTWGVYDSYSEDIPKNTAYEYLNPEWFNGNGYRFDNANDRLSKTVTIQNGSDSSSVSKQLDGTTDVTSIVSTDEAFAALRNDGSVVVWGNAGFGGDKFTGFWGYKESGYGSSTVLANSIASQLDGTVDVTTILSTQRAFAALKADGSVVTWGDSFYGGNSKAVADKLSSGVVKIASDNIGFAALKQDGSIVTWGNADSKAKDNLSILTIFSNSDDLATYQAAKLKAYLASGDSSAIKDKLSSGVVAFANPETDDVYTAPTAQAITTGLMLNGTTENDTLTGGNGNDTINGNGGFDSIDGGAGDDVINVSDRSPNGSIITGGAGKDTINITYLSDAATYTVTDFKSGEDTLKLNSGHFALNLKDVENSHHSYNFMWMSYSNNVVKNISDLYLLNKDASSTFDYSKETTVQKITGTDGDDIIIGGSETDTLTGGNGADIFVLTSLSYATDTITDFKTGTDKIQLGIDGAGRADWSTLLGTPLPTNFSDNFISVAYGKSTFPVTADTSEGRAGRFIFDTTNKTLWLDTNGNTIVSSSGAVEGNNEDVAVLQLTGTANLRAVDFIFG